jgi:hypothetical protein
MLVISGLRRCFSAGYYPCFQAKAAETKVMNSQMEALKKERVAQAEARCVFLRV